MTAGAAGSGRLMVVVSNDYGELGTALYFLAGCAPSSAPLLLLPPVLAHALESDAKTLVAVYRHADDLRAHLDAYRPDTVLLATGYLLAADAAGPGVIEVWRLLRLARRRGIRLLTSDPFLGIRPHPLRLLGSDLRRRANRDALLAALAMVPAAWLLRELWHVYPAPLQQLPALASDPRCRAYFGGVATTPSQPTEGEPPTWLFVLSALEHRLLQRAHGAAWLQALQERLLDGQRAGRKAVLVGPPELTRQLTQRLPAGPLLQLHSQLPYPAYMHCLLAAERVFFWNMMSFSILHRVLAGRPAHFFDEGHLARIHPPFWQAGLQLFYGGWQPPRLDQHQTLHEDDLAQQAEQALPVFGHIARGLRALPASATLMVELAPQPGPRRR